AGRPSSYATATPPTVGASPVGRLRVRPHPALPPAPFQPHLPHTQLATASAVPSTVSLASCSRQTAVPSRCCHCRRCRPPSDQPTEPARSASTSQIRRHSVTVMGNQQSTQGAPRKPDYYQLSTDDLGKMAFAPFVGKQPTR